MTMVYKLIVIYHSGKQEIERYKTLFNAEQIFNKRAQSKTVKKVMLKLKNEMVKRT